MKVRNWTREHKYVLSCSLDSFLLQVNESKLSLPVVVVADDTM